MTQRDVIQLLRLEPLQPEGGYYRQTFFSAQRTVSGGLNRALSSCIFYLLTSDSYSAFHRIQGTEIFHFYLGDAAEIFQIDHEGRLDRQELGTALQLGQQPQVIVPSMNWQALRLLPGGSSGWALLGTTVSPGFEFEDFELALRAPLTERYPEHKDLIAALTRG